MTTNTPATAASYRLVLVRHAAAEDLRAAHAAGRDEASRRLTAAGESAADALGRMLHERLGALPFIAASPLCRARQTAERLAAQTRGGSLVALPALAPGGSLAGLLDWAREQPAGTTLAVVGHAPDIGRYAMSLLKRSTRPAPPVPTAGAIVLEVPATDLPAELLWSHPAELARALQALRKKGTFSR